MVELWEDDLGDNGLTMSDFRFFFNFRFRCMEDSFFALLRQYTRVDDVIIRIFDTRIYHEFKDDFILREFSARENSYDELKEKGFLFNSEFLGE